eukprot:SAG11_NODE_13953_length_631_cov_1.738722_1_plen_116_part_10
MVDESHTAVQAHGVRTGVVGDFPLGGAATAVGVGGAVRQEGGAAAVGVDPAARAGRITEESHRAVQHLRAVCHRDCGGRMQFLGAIHEPFKNTEESHRAVQHLRAVCHRDCGGRMR